MKIQKK
jgi:hypothetical protein